MSKKNHAAIDESAVRAAAEDALRALEVDAEVVAVTRQLGDGKWCVSFSGGYGDFCDEFRDEAGENNSPAVIREKVKRHLLARQNQAMVASPRKHQRGGVRASAERRDEGVLDSVREVVGQVVGAVTQSVGGLAGQGADLAVSAGEAASGVIRAVSRTAGALMPTPSGPASRPTLRAGARRVAKSEVEAAPRAAEAAGRDARSTGKGAGRAGKAPGGGTTKGSKSPRAEAKASTKKGSAKGRKRAGKK